MRKDKPLIVSGFASLSFSFMALFFTILKLLNLNYLNFIVRRSVLQIFSQIIFLQKKVLISCINIILSKTNCKYYSLFWYHFNDVIETTARLSMTFTSSLLSRSPFPSIFSKINTFPSRALKRSRLIQFSHSTHSHIPTFPSFPPPLYPPSSHTHTLTYPLPHPSSSILSPTSSHTHSSTSATFLPHPFSPFLHHTLSDRQSYPKSYYHPTTLNYQLPHPFTHPLSPPSTHTHSPNKILRHFSPRTWFSVC